MPSSIDPTFPADGAPVSKGALRDQLLTLRAELEHGGFVVNPVTLAESTAAQALADIYGALITSRVATIAELRAIPPAPGLVVEVLGYHTPGDGGGGVFRAEMAGAAPTDGGIVFAHTGDESAEQTHSRPASAFTSGFGLPHQNLLWGSVAVEPDGPGTTVFLDLHLHGHRYGTDGNGFFALVDHGAGTVAADGQKRIQNYLDNYDGGGNATVRYKHLTDARRWVRVTDGYTLDVRWFGAIPDGTTDNADHICWALNAAYRLGFKEVRLNGDGFRYYGSIELPPHGLVFGWGRMTCTDGDMLEHLADSYWSDGLISESLAPEKIFRAYRLGRVQTTISPGDDARSWGLKDLELDGNWENNTGPLTDTSAHTQQGGVENVLQNTMTWGGFNASVIGDRHYPAIQHGYMENVDIHGFGSNCYLGSGSVYISGQNVRLGYSVRNHCFYQLHGALTDLTIYGFSWASWGKTEHCSIHGLHIAELKKYSDVGLTPDGWGDQDQDHIINYEGLRRGDGGDLEGVLSEMSSYKWRWQQTGLQIVGGHWNLEGMQVSGVMIQGSGPQLSLSNISIWGPTTGSGELRVLDEVTLGNETQVNEGWSIKNVVLVQRGVPLTFSGSHDPQAVLTVEDCSIQDLRGYEGAASPASALTKIVADTPRTGPNASARRQIAFNRLRLITPVSWLAQVDVRDATATPVDLIVRDSTLRLATNTVLRAEDGTGTLAGMSLQDTTKIRVVMENTDFTLGADSNWANTEVFFALTYFRGCTTPDGLTSEDAGSVALVASGGEDHVDAPTSLFWAPRTVHVMPRSSAAATRFSHVEMLANDGTSPVESVADRRQPVLRFHFDGPLGAGEDVRFGWDAAVRPF